MYLKKAVLKQNYVLKHNGLKPARLLCSWDFPGKKTGMGCHALLQGTLNPKTSLIDLEDKLTNTILCMIPQQCLVCIFSWKYSRIKFWKCWNDSCREPEWGAPPVVKVVRREARHTQRRDRASRVPLDILEHLPPKTRVCLLYCFVLSPLTLRGLFPTTISLSLIKS